jgi:hypothetical protein
VAKTPSTPATPASAGGTKATGSSISNGAANDLAAGKGHATPTRKEKEAARKRPLVSNDRTEARRQSRVELQAQRERARIGMANGEERYLQVRDRGPQKRYIRDYVDARINVGEALIPLMFLVIVLQLASPALQAIGLIALWAFVLVGIADAIVLGFLVKRKLAAKFGADRVERGIRFYAAMRGLQMRVLRLPKPQVKRGKFPV